MKRMRFWPLAFVPWLLLILVGCSESKDEKVEYVRPSGTVEDIVAFAQRDDTNVVFILIDTLRADHLSPYGYERDTSPVMAEMAESGVLFRQHISQSSWTKCSMASLWTGMYPARTGVIRTSHKIPEEATLPAEIFKDSGFRTAGIWRNSWIAPNFGFAQGFENYTMPAASKGANMARADSPNLLLQGSDADVILSTAGFLRAYGHERFFLYLHLMDVHQYVSSPDEAIFGTGYEDIYDNSILWTDKLIGFVLEELEERDLLDRTLVVIASDHGEAFGEHGIEGHARDVYGEVTQTPWIIQFPFALEGGIEVTSRTANVDVWPTLLELLGLPPLPDPDGRSRIPEIVAFEKGAAPPENENSFALLDKNWGQEQQESNPLVAINKGNWRLFRSHLSPKKIELYDKAGDPAEEENVAESHPEVAEDLTELILDHLEGPPPPWGDTTPSIELDDLQLNQLRALGYGVD